MEPLVTHLATYRRIHKLAESRRGTCPSGQYPITGDATPAATISEGEIDWHQAVLMIN